MLSQSFSPNHGQCSNFMLVVCATQTKHSFPQTSLSLSLSLIVISVMDYHYSLFILFLYCKFGNFREGLFRETSHMRSFVKIKPSRIGEITLSFTDIDKSRHCHEFSTSQNFFNAIREKIFSRKFANLQYRLIEKSLRLPKVVLTIFMLGL